MRVESRAQLLKCTISLETALATNSVRIYAVIKCTNIIWPWKGTYIAWNSYSLVLHIRLLTMNNITSWNINNIYIYIMVSTFNILRFPGSNLNLETVYHDWGLPCFPSVLQRKCQHNTLHDTMIISFLHTSEFIMH
jgi:hypothetical protein